MDRGAWQATVHGVAKNWTQLSDYSRRQNGAVTHAHTRNLHQGN